MKTIESIKGADIYLLDQIMKGTFHLDHKILDAGCGRGRNMTWFVQNGFNIFGCDANPNIITEAENFTGLSPGNFAVTTLEEMPYKNAQFDAIICNAVLHFARSETHFLAMVNELYRVLKPDGVLFIRMTSTFGLPENYEDIGDGCFLLQDGSTRFLLNHKLLDEMKNVVGFKQLEPVKSVLVEELRSMTTLVLKRV